MTFHSDYSNYRQTIKEKMKTLLSKILTAVFIAIPFKLMSCNNDDSVQIVDSTSQYYSYKEMRWDVDCLWRKYPDIISYKLYDYTSQGRQIPVILFGDTLAEKKVMITASIHGREYRASHIVMSMLERYARDYHSGEFKGRKYRDIFKNTLFVILPMVNPDGVEIAQRGAEACTTEDAKMMVEEEMRQGIYYDQIKANARGVDINYNFRNCFGKSTRKKNKRGFYYYEGERPYSEVEACLMRSIAEKWDFDCFLNYHTCGNVIFYGCLNAQPSVNNAALKIAKLVRRHTKFVVAELSYSKAAGTWADEVEYYYKKPSVTIESGSMNPVPVEEFSKLFNKNKDVWADLSIYLNEK